MTTDRNSLMRCLCILGAVNAILSIIAIIVGAIAVNTSNAKFPYNAGGGVIAGTTVKSSAGLGLPAAIFLSLCPLCTYLNYRKDPGKDYDGCMLCMVIYFGSVGIWGPPLALGMCGVYGLVECGKPDGGRGKVCAENTDTKIAMSYLTLFVSAFLIVIELAIFFTCCCNSSKFGIPLTTEAESAYFNSEISSYMQRYLNEARMEEARAQYMLNTRRVVPPIGNRDTRNDTRNEVPSAPELDFGVNPSDQNMTFENDRGETELSDPPPSYDEVMKGTIV